MIYVLVALATELPDGAMPDDMRIIYTGVGKVNAAYHAMKTALLPDCEMIINYGTAGTLKPELAGRFLRVNCFKQRDIDGRPLAERGITPFDEGDLAGDICFAHAGVSLSTGDDFVRSPPVIESDLVDMEAYAIAKVCGREGMAFECYKYVTDLADENATDNWRANVAAGATAFLAHLARKG